MHDAVILSVVLSHLTNMMLSKASTYSVQAGKDVVACLNDAMQRNGLNMHVSALV